MQRFNSLNLPKNGLNTIEVRLISGLPTKLVFVDLAIS